MSLTALAWAWLLAGHSAIFLNRFAKHLTYLCDWLIYLLISLSVKRSLIDFLFAKDVVSVRSPRIARSPSLPSGKASHCLESKRQISASREKERAYRARRSGSSLLHARNRAPDSVGLQNRDNPWPG